MAVVTKMDIVEGLRGLGINAPVMVHSSLSSFGCVEGGAGAVVEALTQAFPLVMMPAFTWGNNWYPDEAGRIKLNGYASDAHTRTQREPQIFTLDLPVKKSLGVIPEAFRGMPGAARSSHPSHSVAVIGERAAALAATQTNDDPLAPIEALIDEGGWIILLGTDLNSCTALHLSEMMAGRKYFIRWRKGPDGNEFRVRSPGCSLGFNNLEESVASVERRTTIGDCLVRAYPGGEFVRLAARAIMRDPEITICPRQGCIFCHDTIAGGPVE